LTRPATHEVAEHLIEDIGKAACAKAPTMRPASLRESIVTEAVIGRALVFVF
jgi:hypothetical protein